MTYKILCFTILFALFSCNSKTGTAHQGAHKKANQLINESSPYLLQHAYNPVNWHPWNDEALAKAKAENKLIIISVGYAACHWCHVMEHESFEDSLVSAIMNEHFIPIKVDREERPDVDNVYMTACHLASGRSCGWPLNAFALPDGRPFWAGTYFPKEQWIEILEHWTKSYKENPEELAEYAEKLTNGIQTNERITALTSSDQNFTEEQLDNIVKNFISNIDLKKGGRQGKPKFPMPNNYQFLLGYHKLYNNTLSLDAVMATLDGMALGGIYDHLGGGFARYSTDAEWLVPHFEKMLYDNGQLVSLYSEAFQHTQNPLYQKVVEKTLEYTAREMTNKKGGFYSSLDADSEGEEGKFYVWKNEEVKTLLQDEQLTAVFTDYYEIKPNGNWEHGKNILHRKKTAEKVAKKHNISVEELEAFIDQGKKILMKARDTRIRPGLDDKVLTSWNALMLKGYCDAYQAFGNEAYLQAALRNGNFLLENMLQKDNRLNRNYKDGKSVINAFLDDYALTIDAFMSLYQVTFDEKWLLKAKDLLEYTLLHFYDKPSGMFNYTSDIDPPLVARKMELSDNVIPGSNSTMARVMYKLGLYFYNSDYTNKSKQMLQNLQETIALNPAPNFYSNWCSLYQEIIKPPYEVAIIGPEHQKIRNALATNYLPNVLFLGGASEGSLALLKDKLQEGQTTIYVCQNKVCKLPVTDVEKALDLME